MWTFIGGVYLVTSLLSGALLAWDKRAARLGRRRVPESTLHLVELLGGWPGSLAARPHLRHKTRKLSYSLVLWLIVAAHGAAWGAWGWFLWSRGPS